MPSRKMDKNLQCINEKQRSSKRPLSEECGELNVEVDETVDRGDQGAVGQGCENGAPKKKKKRNSWIWGHFTCRTSETDNQEYAHCNYCTS